MSSAIKTVLFLAWLLFVAVAIRVTADDVITPDDATPKEGVVTQWRFKRVLTTGGILARDASATIALRGYEDDATCAIATQGGCREQLIQYVTGQALGFIRWRDSTRFVDERFEKQLFEWLEFEGEIGAGTYRELSVVCGQDCPLPPVDPEHTPTPCSDIMCTVPVWDLDEAAPPAEDAARHLALDSVDIVFDSLGAPVNITGNAARIKAGPVCAQGSRGASRGCASESFDFRDRSKVESILRNDGSTERFRARVLREGQAAGQLPAGTISGDAL